MNASGAPVLGITGYSGAGKTTLLSALLPRLRARGLRVAVIKHTHHDAQIDQPGKDSHTLRLAGAAQVLLASPRRWALIVEQAAPTPADLPVAHWIAKLPADAQDLVLVEGCRHAAIPKLEVHRPAVGKPLLCCDDPHIIAIASDAAIDLPARLTLLDLNDPAMVSDWLLATLDRHAGSDRDPFMNHGQ